MARENRSESSVDAVNIPQEETNRMTVEINRYAEKLDDETLVQAFASIAQDGAKLVKDQSPRDRMRQSINFFALKEEVLKRMAANRGTNNNSTGETA